MNRLEYNGKHGTIEFRPNAIHDFKFLATPTVGKSARFPTAHHAMDYLKKQAKEASTK